MRGYLLGAVSVFALTHGAAFAQTNIEVTDPVEITNDQEGTVQTSTAESGSASDITINSNGRVFLTTDTISNGPALLIDSDNNVFVSSGGRVELESENSNGDDVTTSGGVGVQIAPGVTSDFEMQGSIRAEDGFTPTDSETDLVDLNEDGTFEADGEADGPFAKDSGKTGLLIGAVDANNNPVAGQSGVTSNVYLDGSSITVVGQDSYGVRVVSDVTGDLLLGGNVTMIGERSTAVSIESDVSGDLELGAINADSPGGQAALVSGDIGGGIRIRGNVSSSGYRQSIRLNELGQTTVDAGDDDLDAANGVEIAGSVSDGIFIDALGAVTLLSGEGAALQIGASGKALTIGEVVLPDDYGLIDEAEFDADTDVEAQGYSFVINGGINAGGVYDGRDATGVLIGGTDAIGNAQIVVFESGGILNTGSVTTSAYDASARTVVLGNGTQASNFDNQGTISSTVFLGYETDDRGDSAFGQARAVALEIEDGSDIANIFNDQGAIFALVSSGGTSGTAILLDSANVETLLNTGTISAVIGTLNVDQYGENATAETAGIDLIAIDARGHNGGLTVRQEQGVARDRDGDGEVDDVSDPILVGDVLFGSGDDVLEITAGTMNGAASFGDGADTFTVSNSEVTSNVSDSDGQLDIAINNGTLALESDQTLSISSLTVTDNGQLDLVVDDSLANTTMIDASGTVSFDESSTLSVGLTGLVGSDFELVLIDAGQLDIQSSQTITTGDAPFLYNTVVTVSDTDPDALVLTLTRKSAAEIGLQGARSTVYDPVLALLDDAENLGSVFASLRTERDFIAAYDQLLPEYASSAIQFSLAANDAATGALSTRLTNARSAPDDLAGLWVQEFAYYADRQGSALAEGYRGEGVGLAAGFDRPWGPFYAVGVNIMGAASQTEEINGFDDPMIAITGQLGVYAGWEAAGLDFAASGGVGIDTFETERSILIDDFSALYYGDWSGWHATASLRAGRDISMGRWLVRPEAHFTYLGLWESGFTETADADTINAGNQALALTIDDRESAVLVGSATLNIGRQFGNDVSWWAPSVRIGYRGEFVDDLNETTARFGETGNPFTLQSESLPGSGVLLGLGLNAGSNYSTFSFAYDADIRDGFVRHVARLMIRLTF